MSLRVRIEPEAVEELRAARDWYNERRDGLGRQFVEAAYEAVSQIQSMPSAGLAVPGVPLDLDFEEFSSGGFRTPRSLSS